MHQQRQKQQWWYVFLQFNLHLHCTLTKTLTPSAVRPLPSSLLHQSLCQLADWKKQKRNKWNSYGATTQIIKDGFAKSMHCWVSTIWSPFCCETEKLHSSTKEFRSSHHHNPQYYDNHYCHLLWGCLHIKHPCWAACLYLFMFLPILSILLSPT